MYVFNICIIYLYQCICIREKVNASLVKRRCRLTVQRSKRKCLEIPCGKDGGEKKKQCLKFKTGFLRTIWTFYENENLSDGVGGARETICRSVCNIIKRLGR